MLTKKEIIEATPPMRDLLTPQALPDNDYTVLNAEEYIAVGCDLRDINGLDISMKPSRPDQCLVLCVAEVSLIYMNPETSDALIEWAAHLSSGKSSKSSTRERTPSVGMPTHGRVGPKGSSTLCLRASTLMQADVVFA
jgi:hypothetical protein